MLTESSLFKSNNDEFQVYLSITTRRIDKELSNFVEGLATLNLKLFPQIEYTVLSKGKRLRPFLVILSAESVGGNREEVMALALAFELLHTATLLQDDLIDSAVLRRDNWTLHKKWSVRDAILTGDVLIALAVDHAAKYGESIMKTIAHSALELCNGEHLDMGLTLQNATEQLYFKMIYNKSASLFSAAASCAALAAGGTQYEVQALAEFGKNMGIAYQVQDDISDLTEQGDASLVDVKNGKVTLPIIHSYATCSLPEKDEIEICLKTVALKKQQDDLSEKSERLLQILHQKGSISYCEKKIADYLNKAIESVSPLKETNYKHYLVALANSLRLKTG